jgi:DNA-binding GntR family transcriptional regulator
MASSALRTTPAAAATRRQTVPGQTLADSLRQAIRLDIVRGRLAPGAPLRTQTLCDEYGCSLAPLREALSWLAADGLASVESQRGFRVATISTQEWQDIIARRLEVETKALTLSIRSGDDRWEGHIVRCAHEYALASQRVLAHPSELDEAWEGPHRALHIALVSACRSPWLLKFCFSLYDHSDRYRRLARPPEPALRQLAGSENELVAAVLARRAPLARRLLREHIHEIGAEVLASTSLWSTFAAPLRPEGGAA